MSKSIAVTLGTAIGNAAAYTVHGAARAVVMTGEFGTDLTTATAAQYAAKNAELAAARAAARAARNQAPMQLKAEPSNEFVEAVKAAAPKARSKAVAA